MPPRHTPHNPATRRLADLQRLLGNALAARVVSNGSVPLVRQWVDGSATPTAAEVGRIELAHDAALMIAAHDPPEILRRWFVDPHPLLDDRSATNVIALGQSELERERVMRAARSFDPLITLLELPGSLDESLNPPLTPEPAPLQDREDRVSFELHRAIAVRLIFTPSALRLVMSANIDRMRDGASQFDQGRVNEWERLSTAHVGELVGVMLGTDETATAMRRASPLAGVLTLDERLDAIRRATLPIDEAGDRSSNTPCWGAGRF